MKIKTINDLLSYVETEEKAQRLINYINSLEELRDIDYKEIKGLKQDNEYLNKVNIELSTEKNRLNNIINELEKWLVNWREMLDCPDFYEEGIIDCINDTLNKLQELKGVDKE